MSSVLLTTCSENSKCSTRKVPLIPDTYWAYDRQTGTYVSLPSRTVVRKPNHSISPHLFLPGITRLFNWIVMGENENRGRSLSEKLAV